MYDYELHRYITADYTLTGLKEEVAFKRDVVISGCFPQVYVENGNLKRSHYRTEDAALELADISNAYDKRIKRLERQVKRYKEALKKLTIDELEAFNHFIHGEPSSLDHWAKQDLFRNAQEKIKDYLNEFKDQEQQKQKENHKEYLRKQIQIFNKKEEANHGTHKTTR